MPYPQRLPLSDEPSMTPPSMTPPSMTGVR